MLQFNINVPSSVYAKYYFDLRTLAEANELSFPAEPLSRDRAQRLEAMSRLAEDRVAGGASHMSGQFLNQKRSASMDNINAAAARRSVAILS
jgi:hypothetical protein